MDNMDLFQELTKEEYEKLQPVAKPRKTTATRKRAAVTEPRNNTTWYGLPHIMGFCGCPMHEDIQRELNPGQKEYRDKYPVRMTYEIEPGLFICRDCFTHEGDKLAKE